MGLGLEPEFTVYGSVAQEVVEMAVGTEQVTGCELTVADVTDDGLALFGIVGSAVDDDALTGVVAHHVAVLGEHVAFKSLDIEHFWNSGLYG
jgi:hypothetical protein